MRVTSPYKAILAALKYLDENPDIQDREVKIFRTAYRSRATVGRVLKRSPSDPRRVTVHWDEGRLPPQETYVSCFMTQFGLLPKTAIEKMRQYDRKNGHKIFFVMADGLRFWPPVKKGSKK